MWYPNCSGPSTATNIKRIRYALTSRTHCLRLVAMMEIAVKMNGLVELFSGYRGDGVEVS